MPSFRSCWSHATQAGEAAWGRRTEPRTEEACGSRGWASDFGRHRGATTNAISELSWRRRNEEGGRRRRPTAQELLKDGTWPRSRSRRGSGVGPEPTTSRQDRWIFRSWKSGGTVWRLVSRISAPRISPSASLNLRKFVENQIAPPGAMRPISRLRSSGWCRWTSKRSAAFDLEKVGGSTTARS